MEKDNILRLSFGEKTYILVGTAHVSQESIDEVNALIKSEQPNQVCIELDDGRYAAMSQEDSWKNLDIYKVLKSGKGFLLLSNLMLSSYQKRLGIDIGVKPGQEMRAAVDTCKALNIPFSMIDRDIQVTLRRAWGTSSLVGKAKLMTALLSASFSNEKIDSSQIEELKKTSELHGMMEELASYLPTVKKVLIDERDQFMATKLFETNDTTILAVVGAGHVPGMKTHLESLHAGSSQADLAAISNVPKPSIVGKIIGWLIPAVIIGFIVYGFITGGVEKGLTNTLIWVLCNGGAAALGSLIALGHPLTILATFVGAPFATLNPFLGIGMIAAPVEALIRKPQVGDLADLQNDITTIRGFYRNRVTRVLLVLILSSLGGVLGNLVLTPAVVAYFAGK